MKVFDLFSGLGGFSQAFLDRGHNVTRIELDPQFKNIPRTKIFDVLDLEPWDFWNVRSGFPDIILASPPCNHFSIAAVSTHWPKPTKEPTEATKQQIELVKYTVSLIKEVVKAKEKNHEGSMYWMVENPRGMMRKVLGKPDKFIYMSAYHNDPKRSKKPTDLWGAFPPIDWLVPLKWVKAPRGSKTGVQDPSLTSAERALIPYEFSLAVCLAAEGNSLQRTLVPTLLKEARRRNEECDEE